MTSACATGASRPSSKPRFRRASAEGGPDHHARDIQPGGLRTGNAPGVDRPRGPRAAVRSLRDGPDGAEPRRAGTGEGSEAERLGAPLDHRHLRLSGGGLAHHDGDARRPDRPPEAPAHRGGGVRRRLGRGRVLEKHGHAHRRPRAPRDRGGDARAVDPVTHPQHVPRRRGADVRHLDLDHELLGRRGDRPAPRRARPPALPVGRGVPAGRSRDGAPPARRAEAPPGVPRSQRGPARPRERRAVACERAPRDLRREAERGVRLQRSAPSSCVASATSRIPSST
jgi:hypothetical protein